MSIYLMGSNVRSQLFLAEIPIRLGRLNLLLFWQAVKRGHKAVVESIRQLQIFHVKPISFCDVVAA